MSFSPNFSFWFLEVLVSNDMFPKVHLIQVLRVYDKFCSDSFRSWNLDTQQQKKHCIRIFYVIILTYGTNGDVDWKTCCWLSQRGQPRCSSVHRELRHSSKWRPVMETGRTQPNTSNVMVWPNSAEKTSNDYRPLHTTRHEFRKEADTNTKRPRVRDDGGEPPCWPNGCWTLLDLHVAQSSADHQARHPENWDASMPFLGKKKAQTP